MHEAGQISPENDIEEACTSIGTGPNQPEQLLIDLYVRQLHFLIKLSSVSSSTDL